MENVNEQRNKSSSSRFNRQLRGIPDDVPYERRKSFDKTTPKFGQLKLLLVEIEFLTFCVNLLGHVKDIVVVYAGAAPGIHLSVIFRLFPFIHYVLIDPTQFAVKPSKNVQIINKFADDKLMQKLKTKYKKQTVLFISDIRNIKSAKKECEIVKDNDAQLKWHNILRPFKSMLKLHLPFSSSGLPNKYKYLQGNIYLQPFAGKTSTETRLYVDTHAPLVEYDCVKYENMLFHFNTVERPSLYEHQVTHPGIDKCYDCYSLVYILQYYMNSFFSIKFSSINAMIELIYKNLNAKDRKMYCVLDGKIYHYKFTDVNNPDRKLELTFDIRREDLDF